MGAGIFWQEQEDSILRFAPWQVCFANVAPVHRFAVSCSFDQASYETEKPTAYGDGLFCLAGAGGLEPATHGFGVASNAREALKILDFLHVSTHFSRKTVCRGCV